MVYDGIVYNTHDRTDYSQKYTEYLWQMNMFELTPVPPKLKDWQDYFIRCKEANSEVWFQIFLHHYEHRLNNIVSGIVSRYALHNQFVDIKMLYVTAMWDKLQKYDSASEIPFLTYSIRGIWRELHSYIRENSHGFSGVSEYRDKQLRRIVYEYDRVHLKCNEEEAIHMVAQLLSMHDETVSDYIAEAYANTQFVQFYKQYSDELDIDDDNYSGEDVTCDNTPSPEEQVILAELSDSLFDAFYKLEYIDRVIVSGRCRFCENCLEVCKQKSFDELATMLEMSSTDGVEKRYKRAVQLLKSLIYNC